MPKNEKDVLITITDLGILFTSNLNSEIANIPAPIKTERNNKNKSSELAWRKTDLYKPLKNKESNRIPRKIHTLPDNKLNWYSRELGAKRTAKAKIIETTIITVSIESRNKDLVFLGKSAK